MRFSPKSVFINWVGIPRSISLKSILEISYVHAESPGEPSKPSSLAAEG